MKNDCQICRKHPIMYKDYRFLDNCGLQGKVLVCQWCRDLNDVAISDIMRDELDPEDFYIQEIHDEIKKHNR